MDFSNVLNIVLLVVNPTTFFLVFLLVAFVFIGSFLKKYIKNTAISFAISGVIVALLAYGIYKLFYAEAKPKVSLTKSPTKSLTSSPTSVSSRRRRRF